MGAIGIVAEYNPFHTGHALQLARTRELLGADLPAVAVMSGSWVQQADCAIADKWTRAQLALMGAKIWCWSCPRCGQWLRQSPLPEGRYPS